MSTAIKQTGRMEWLDAMRGFTMILVVAYHVAEISYGQTVKTSASLPFLVLFRMPLFFFVSGFLAYKANFEWSAGNTLRLLGKKIHIQVLPALIFLCICIVLRKKDFGDTFYHAMLSPFKGGYWFTWVLLQMFMVYYLVSFSVQKLSQRGRNICILILWLLSVCVYESIYLPKLFGDVMHNSFLMTSSLIQTMQYLQFFLLGNLVHRYWGRTQQLFDSMWFFPVICILCFFCCADIFRWHALRFGWTNLPRTLSMYGLLTIVVMFFRYYQHLFTKDKWVGRTFQYIGTRTLDVYLLHFILLPKIPEIGKWLNAHQPNFILDFVLSLVGAAFVIAFCLLVSNVLRISPLFSENLFGRKVKKEG